MHLPAAESEAFTFFTHPGARRVSWVAGGDPRSAHSERTPRRAPFDGGHEGLEPGVHPEAIQEVLHDRQCTEHARRRLVDLIQEPGNVLPGGLVERMMKYRKQDCRRKADTPQLHGHYVQWGYSKGRTRFTGRPTPEQQERYGPEIERGQRLMDLLVELDEAEIRRVERAEGRGTQMVIRTCGKSAPAEAHPIRLERADFGSRPSPPWWGCREEAPPGRRGARALPKTLVPTPREVDGSAVLPHCEPSVSTARARCSRVAQNGPRAPRSA